MLQKKGMLGMKRILGLVLILAMLFGVSAMAETDYEALIAEKDAKIAELEAQIETLTARIEELEADEAEADTFEPLQRGSKGDAVVEVQKRLKELKYLSGEADGAFGKGTAAAVSSFQAAAGLEQTGIVDEETYIALMADDAPECKEYVSLDYSSNARNPESYEGMLIKFSGKVLQVSEGDDYVVFRIATKGSYDNVVYCIYVKPDNYSRILEDDRVNVWGTSTGVYTYTTVMGSEITIPSCVIDRIELK